MEFTTSIQDDDPIFLEEEYSSKSDNNNIRKVTLTKYMQLDGDDEKKTKKETNCWKTFKSGLRLISVG
jgi:hypothetical protein